MPGRLRLRSATHGPRGGRHADRAVRHRGLVRSPRPCTGAAPTAASAAPGGGPGGSGRPLARRGGGDIIDPARPPRVRDPEAAYRTAGEAREILLGPRRHPGARCASSSYDAAGEPAAPSSVGFPATGREALPAASRGRTWPRPDNNAADDNFGCAITANMAARSPIPPISCAPRPSTPPDATRRQMVLDKYREGRDHLVRQGRAGQRRGLHRSPAIGDSCKPSPPKAIPSTSTSRPTTSSPAPATPEDVRASGSDRAEELGGACSRPVRRHRPLARRQSRPSSLAADRRPRMTFCRPRRAQSPRRGRRPGDRGGGHSRRRRQPASCRSPPEVACRRPRPCSASRSRRASPSTSSAPTPATAELVESAAAATGAWSAPPPWCAPGGLAAAVEHYQNQPTPFADHRREPSTPPRELLGQLDRLAEVCDPGTKVVVIGVANDIALYRELMRRGRQRISGAAAAAAAADRRDHHPLRRPGRAVRRPPDRLLRRQGRRRLLDRWRTIVAYRDLRADAANTVIVDLDLRVRHRRPRLQPGPAAGRRRRASASPTGSTRCCWTG